MEPAARAVAIKASCLVVAGPELLPIWYQVKATGQRVARTPAQLVASRNITTPHFGVGGRKGLVNRATRGDERWPAQAPAMQWLTGKPNLHIRFLHIRAATGPSEV
jgi:hypothetical protein